MTDPHFTHKGIRESSYYQLTLAWGGLILRSNKAAKGSAERKAYTRWIDAIVDEKHRRDFGDRPLTAYVMSEA